MRFNSWLFLAPLMTGVLEEEMSIRINQSLVPEFIIQRQAESLMENVAKGMPGKPKEVVRLAAYDLAKERIIDQTLMAQESKKRKYEIDPEEVKKGMRKWIRENGGKKIFAKKTHPLIKNQNDLREEIISQIQFNRLLEDESTCPMITEDEARSYYESRPDQFRSEETVTASHLLKKASSEEEFDEAEKQVEIIRKKILKGEDFKTLVRVESDDSVQDGNLGTFGRGKMVPAFEKAAFQLEVGELSQPVRSPFGWHLILLKDRTEGQLIPFEEMKNKIQNYLTERKKDKVFEEYLDGLRNDAEIVEIDEK